MALGGNHAVRYRIILLQQLRLNHDHDVLYVCHQCGVMQNKQERKAMPSLTY
jgi:hypothetical protein